MQIQRGGEDEETTSNEIEFMNEGQTVTAEEGLTEAKKKARALDKMIVSRTANDNGNNDNGSKDKITKRNRNRLLKLSAKRDKRIALADAA